MIFDADPKVLVTCARCNSEDKPREKDFCPGCVAWLSGKSEIDPVEVRRKVTVAARIYAAAVPEQLTLEV